MIYSKKSSESKTSKPSSGSKSSKSSPGSKTSKPSSESKTSKPSSGSKTSKPSVGSKTTKSSTGSETSKSSSGSKTSKPSAGSKTSKSSSGSKTSKPSSGSKTSKPSSGSKTSKPLKDPKWTVIPDFPKYEISVYGQIRTLKGRPIKQHPDGNYLVVKLYDNSGQHDCRVHRLVAQTFIPNPKNLPEVDHIDNNKKHNSAPNLRWVTGSENIDAYCKNFRPYRKILQYDMDGKLIKIWHSSQELLKEHPKYKLVFIRDQSRGLRESAYGHAWEFNPPLKERIKADPNEKFRTIRIEGYDLSNYAISKAGRIKNKNDNYLLETRAEPDGYVRVSLKCEKSARSLKFRVHRLMAFTYLHNDDPDKKTEVDHKDKDKGNNNLPNLEWVSPHENMIRASGKMVKMIDKDTNEVLKILAVYLMLIVI